MTIVFDVWVDGKKKETIKPRNQKLSDIRHFVKMEASSLIHKYGSNVYLQRRFEY
ncbi:hypothetical protein ACFQZE_02305 [Paenibacillus sp. GCM10027627]|uniref:hypothetical protein n=1 Tax=unclassified Paenibacillus TaxID=185978 RepID=UPI0036387A0F